MKESWNKVRNKIEVLWINVFWQYPQRLLALKIAIAVALLIIPFEIIGKPFFGMTLALGAVATALSETDDYPRGRIKALAIMLLSFFVSSASVELLRPHPLLFGIGLIGSTFFFIILGGMGERYRGITFGALLIAIYTMLGTYFGNPWYYQPILLPLGGLGYGVVSLVLLYIRPWRLLKEQLAQGYRKLGDYTAHKAKFFPSDPKLQDTLRNQLAQKNIAVVQSIGQSRTALISYAKEVKDHPVMPIYYNKWLLLQQMHERVASSHERYDLLSQDTKNPQLIEGFGQLLKEISKAIQQVGTSLLTDIPYKHPISLSWTITALHEMMQRSESDPQYPSLSLLLKNLTELEQTLRTIDDQRVITSMPDIEYQSQPIVTRLKKLMRHTHPRFRYAVRLSICFAIGYALMYFLKIEKGDWILLTSLFVCQQTYSETRQRLFERVMGTIAGVILGILLAQLLPTPTGQIILLVGSIYLFMIWLRKKYAVAVIFITTYVLAAFNIQADQGIAVMGPRIVDTLIGAFLAYFVVRFIWPDWQYKHLPELLRNALAKNEAYLQAIYTPNYPPMQYRESRQQTHEADTALTLAWRGIKVEPKRKSFYEKKAFTLTYLNHALLSYLSALGAHAQNQQFNEEELSICKNVTEVLQQAQILLADKDILPNTPLVLREIKEWEDVLYERKKESNNRRITLLYNLAHTAKELLKEAQLLQQNKVTA
ncbi:putative membrane protein (TIGR01666 family) [Balneicella halophila]|uniref:Putative membrane protein (TIGR01666 family) n=1 Tax=Balneicella halophila TaxID=1537566 RepID=A0A7L4UMY5_BALHA|nr:FUSC family membrane protein [Balneicella halophila]PVX49991.1 putative membrane protein (TIGR01666 family) [Balneicella halophila]